jgi:hypothetical protein
LVRRLFDLGALGQQIHLGTEPEPFGDRELQPDLRATRIDQQPQCVDGLHLRLHEVPAGLHCGGALFAAYSAIPGLPRLDDVLVDQDSADHVEGRASGDIDEDLGVARSGIVRDFAETGQEAAGFVPNQVAADDQHRSGYERSEASFARANHLFRLARRDLRVEHR